MVELAQSVRASGCGSEGRGFESHIPPQNELSQMSHSIWASKRSTNGKDRRRKVARF